MLIFADYRFLKIQLGIVMGWLNDGSGLVILSDNKPYIVNKMRELSDQIDAESFRLVMKELSKSGLDKNDINDGIYFTRTGAELVAPLIEDFARDFLDNPGSSYSYIVEYINQQCAALTKDLRGEVLALEFKPQPQVGIIYSPKQSRLFFEGFEDNIKDYFQEHIDNWLPGESEQTPQIITGSLAMFVLACFANKLDFLKQSQQVKLMSTRYPWRNNYKNN